MKVSTPTALAAVMVATCAVGGVAWARDGEIAAPSSTINGCYSQVSGLLRIVDPGTACRQPERAISWNEAGAPGPAGPPGMSGYVRVVGPWLYIGSEQEVDCPPGDRVLGGGFELETDPGLTDVIVDAPTDDGTGWRVHLGTSGYRARVYAICAMVAP